MKRRMIISSTIVVLLMLVSIQMVLLGNVKSDPSWHYGDAEVGKLYVGELNVESAVQSFDYIGIAHANVSDDWVLWEEGKGNISVDWEVDIGNNHPEYLIVFMMGVYNVVNNTFLGSDQVYESYDENTISVDSGALGIEIEFTPEEIRNGEATLVALFEVQVRINDTSEAKNFTSIAHDRCIIGVDFVGPVGLSFAPFVENANDMMPPFWSYIPDWEVAFASDESEMMNETTILFGDLRETHQSSGSSVNPTWHFGHIEVIHEDPEDEPDITVSEEDDHITWTLNYPWGNPNSAVGLTRVSYEFDTWHPIFNPFPHPFCLMGFILRYSNTAIFALKLFWWHGWKPHQKSIYDLSQALDGWIDEEDNNIYFVAGRVAILYGIRYRQIDISDYYLHIDDSDNNDDVGSPSYDWSWRSYCAYQKIDTSLVGSVVKGNIAGLLKSENFVVYTYAGDNGETTVELICE